MDSPVSIRMILCLFIGHSMLFLTAGPGRLDGQAPPGISSGDTPSHSRDQDRVMSDWFFVYNQDLGTGSVAVTVHPAGQSTVRITRNLGPRDEIGFYGVAVHEEGIAGIRRAIQRSGYREIPTATTLPPGTATLTLGEGRAGEVPQLSAFALSGLPEPLRDLVTAMDAFIEEVRAHPIRVIRGGVRVESRTVHRGAPMALDVTLTNAGTHPVDVDNLVRADQEGRVRLSLRRSGAGGDEEGAGGDEEGAESVVLEVPASAVRFGALEEEGRGPATAVLEPGAGAEVSIRIQQTGDLPTGRYGIALFLDFPASGADGAGAVHGTLRIDAGQVEVVRGGAVR